MAVFTKTAQDVFAPTTAGGAPRGADMAEAQNWGVEVQRGISGAEAGRVDQVTWAALSAITGTRVGQPALVYGPDASTHTDPVVGGNVANTGAYVWSASPAGWQRVGGLPAALVHALNSGEGTANAVQATTSAEYATAAYGALITVNFVAANTGAMTLSINGETARALVTNTGAAIPSGYVASGMSALVQIDSNGDYRLFSYGDAASVQAAVEALVAVAETARDEAVAAAASVSIVATEAAFLAALAGAGGIRVSSAVTSATLTTSTQVDDLLAKFELIVPEGPLEITLPAGTFAYSATELFKFAHHSALITLRGSTPVETTLTSVSSVTGSAYNWDVVLNVGSGTGIEVGNILKLWNVGPLPSLSGDNAFLLREMPIDNEIFTPRARIGGMTITAGTNTASFASGTLSNHIEVDDLFHRGGQTNQVASIDDGTRTITFDDNWTVAASGELCYLVTKPGVGSCTLSGAQPSTTLDFANSITATNLNAGDMILTRGLAVKIASITDGNTVELSHPVSFTGGAPYSIVTPGTLHEGGWRVTAVSGNQITVKNRGATKPPVNKVAGGEVIAIKTVLHQTGSGDGAFPLCNNAGLHLEDIALRGSYAHAGSHGIAGNGRDPVYGPTQNGVSSSVLLGYNTAAIDFGRNYYGTYGCVLNARGTMWTGARETNVWADIGSDVNLRHCVASGALSGDGIRYGPATRGKTTETRANGNSDDGFQTFMGAENYGEIPFATGNLGMGARIQGGQSECGQMVSQLNGLSGVYASEPGGNVKMPNSLILCNAREGIEVDGLVNVNAEGSFIAGTSGTAGNGYVVNARNGAKVQADNISAGGNKLGLYATTGAQIDAHDHAPALAIAGVTRANEFDLKGSIIRTSAALAAGVSALAVDGGSALSFFKMATQVFNFPSIADGASASTTVTVTGASTTGMCAFANSNSVPAGITLSAYISATNTVTVTATNNSGGALDPGNATLTAIVIGAS